MGIPSSTLPAHVREKLRSGRPALPPTLFAPNIVNLVVPYPLSVNRFWRIFQPPRGRARIIVSKEGRAYKKTVLALALAQGIRPTGGICSVIIDVYRPQKRGDTDNCLKVLLDSLTGAAWEDDSAVKRIEIEQFDDPGNPRAEVEIRRIG